MSMIEPRVTGFGAQQALASGAISKTSISSDFETFLKMLTVQMQNQDPLNPVDSEDFATQLATFSSVEQAVLSNDLLSQIVSNSSSNGLKDLAGWVGMDVLSTAPTVFDGTPVSLRPDIHPNADRVSLTVMDENGDVIQRLDIDPQEQVVKWSGVNDDGTGVRHGIYSFEVHSFVGDELLLKRISPAYGRVEEARLHAGEVLLRLADGSEISSRLVTGLRAGG